METENIKSDGVVYLPDSGERYPMSVVWTTLPGISFLLPPIGHIGIADSKGIIFDFSGPYQVTVGSLMCGPAKRVWRLDPSDICELNGKETVQEAYDAAVAEGACVYGKRFHNLVLDNCHCHVALILNKLKYKGKSNWNQVRVFAAIWYNGGWIRRRQAATVYGPCLFLLFVFTATMVFVGVKNR